MDLTDEELEETKKMNKLREERALIRLKAEIEESTYCITLYGSDKNIVSKLLSEHELIEDKIKRLENIIDYNRAYEWEKEIYCVDVLKQIRKII